MRTDGDGDDGDVVLCVNNMSRFPQPVELDLRGVARARCRIELTGGVPFPPIGELPYLLTLPGHGFYWFSITPAATGPEAVRSVATRQVRPGDLAGRTASCGRGT